MIKITCADTGMTVLLTDMVPFQGDLKKRSQADIDEMSKSLDDDGLLDPFHLWRDEDKYYILDGHHRRSTLLYRVANGENDLLTQQFPSVLINAKSKEEAQKAVLQYSSQYGKVTRQGMINFTKAIPQYTAPIIRKAIPTVVRRNKLNDDIVNIRLKVPKNMVQQLTNLLKQVDGVELY